MILKAEALLFWKREYEMARFFGGWIKSQTFLILGKAQFLQSHKVQLNPYKKLSIYGNNNETLFNVLMH